MEWKQITCRLKGEELDTFEMIRSELSKNGSMKISDGNVIKYLMAFHIEAIELLNSIPNES